MNFRTLRDIDLENKTVLLRADLNVPTKEGIVTDTTRIDRLKPTIDFLSDHNTKIIILSHFGRPKGKEDPQYSLNFLPPVLEKQWKTEVGFGPDSNKNITLLENLRFNPGEEKNDPRSYKWQPCECRAPSNYEIYELRFRPGYRREAFERVGSLASYPIR